MNGRRGRMGDLGDDARAQTDRELEDREAALLLETTVDWDALRPQVTDLETYEKLIAVVQEATRNNESIAHLKSRLQELGKQGLAVTREVLDRLP